MKKLLICSLLLTLVLFCGCRREIQYETKYVVNCESAELHESPVNSSAVISLIDYAEAVSFEKNSQNGYSKVVYNGVKGYVLSIYLGDEKPDSEPIETPDTESGNFSQVPAYDPYEHLKSNSSDDHIESYITNYIRPIYNSINANINQYAKSTEGEATVWYDSNVCIKKEYAQNAAGYGMSRQYYYRIDSGDLVFAFVFKGEQEYRLYFENDKLIRFIGPDGNIVNNPTATDALEMAQHAIDEAH